MSYFFCVSVVSMLLRRSSTSRIIRLERSTVGTSLLFCGIQVHVLYIHQSNLLFLLRWERRTKKNMDVLKFRRQNYIRITTSKGFQSMHRCWEALRATMQCNGQFVRLSFSTYIKKMSKKYDLGSIFLLPTSKVYVSKLIYKYKV